MAYGSTVYWGQVEQQGEVDSRPNYLQSHLYSNCPALRSVATETGDLSDNTEYTP